MIPISKPFIGEEEKHLVMEVLNSGMLAQGPKVAQLEEEFAEMCGTKRDCNHKRDIRTARRLISAWYKTR